MNFIVTRVSSRMIGIILLVLTCMHKLDTTINHINTLIIAIRNTHAFKDSSYFFERMAPNINSDCYNILNKIITIMNILLSMKIEQNNLILDTMKPFYCIANSHLLFEPFLQLMKLYFLNESIHFSNLQVIKSLLELFINYNSFEFKVITNNYVIIHTTSDGLDNIIEVINIFKIEIQDIHEYGKVLFLILDILRLLSLYYTRFILYKGTLPSDKLLTYYSYQQFNDSNFERHSLPTESFLLLILSIVYSLWSDKALPISIQEKIGIFIKELILSIYEQMLHFKVSNNIINFIYPRILKSIIYLLSRHNFETDLYNPFLIYFSYSDDDTDQIFKRYLTNVPNSLIKNRTRVNHSIKSPNVEHIYNIVLDILIELFGNFLKPQYQFEFSSSDILLLLVAQLLNLLHFPCLQFTFISMIRNHSNFKLTELNVILYQKYLYLVSIILKEADAIHMDQTNMYCYLFNNVFISPIHYIVSLLHYIYKKNMNTDHTQYYSIYNSAFKDMNIETINIDLLENCNDILFHMEEWEIFFIALSRLLMTTKIISFIYAACDDKVYSLNLIQRLLTYLNYISTYSLHNNNHVNNAFYHTPYDRYKELKTKYPIDIAIVNISEPCVNTLIIDSNINKYGFKCIKYILKSMDCVNTENLVQELKKTLFSVCKACRISKFSRSFSSTKN